MRARPPRPLLLAAFIAACASAPGELPSVTSAPAAAPSPLAAVSTSVRAAPGPAPALTEPAAAPAEPRGPRLTSRAPTTWIWPEPRRKKTFLGYVRMGSSVALRQRELVKGEGCSAGYFAVEPRGYVCNDATVTLDPEPAFVTASAATSAVAGPFPYRYALSNGAPMYNRVPSADEWARRERGFGRAGAFLKQPKGLAAHEDLAAKAAIAADDALPEFLRGGAAASPTRLGLVRQTIPLGSMLSFTRAFAAEGRTWLLSPDLTVVPADRVRPFRPSTFRGTPLGGDVELPIAWMRRTPRPQHRATGDGAMEPTGGSWAALSFVRLTGARAERSGRVFLETADKTVTGAALWIAEADATVVEREPKIPFGVKLAQKWIVVRITQGTLVAYEGDRPVYATLVSPGAGGVPVPGQDPVKMSTTPLGTYFVTFKDRATTMAPEVEEGEERKFWIADVPHTQYFNPPFALHASYWHERFGEPTSAGCVNLSPIDAEALFAWSDPQVPEGWQGATGSGAEQNGATTAVVVRR